MSPTSAGSTPSLRELKRRRTRAAIVSAGSRLFHAKGFGETTVAEIAAEAQVGTRTFFSYFSTKEELLFPETDRRVQAVTAALTTRGEHERPLDLLARALQGAEDEAAELVSPLATLRLQLTDTVPVVRARALQIQADAERQIAALLRAAYPGELDEVAAAALVGAVVGALSGARRALFADPASRSLTLGELLRKVADAADVALAPWRRESAKPIETSATGGLLDDLASDDLASDDLDDEGLLGIRGLAGSSGVDDPETGGAR
jgi:AcrR family transcriptional regulator